MSKYFVTGAFLYLLIIGFTSTAAKAQIMDLWPDEIPNSQSSKEAETRVNNDILWIEKVQVPTIEVYRPSKQNSNGMAILICPGGGYQGLAYDWEGTDIAKWLNSLGITGIVLKYRLPKSASVVTDRLAPIQDAQRALRTIRGRAEEWNIQPDKIGVMGFSAGGHLASTLSTRFEEIFYQPTDEIDTHSTRPDFSILIYPVISMQDGVTHNGSKANLLGPELQQEWVQEFSNEQNISENTPPTFLLHSGDDTVVPVKNSLLYYEALINNNIAAEMHIYPKGGHGYSLALDDGYLAEWTNNLTSWLTSIR